MLSLDRRQNSKTVDRRFTFQVWEEIVKLVLFFFSITAFITV